MADTDLSRHLGKWCALMVADAHWSVKASGFCFSEVNARHTVAERNMRSVMAELMRTQELESEWLPPPHPGCGALVYSESSGSVWGEEKPLVNG